MSNSTLTSQFARIPFFRENKLAQAIATKMVPSLVRNGSTNQTSQGSDIAPDHGSLERISKLQASDIDDTNNLMQILPDLGLAKEIMTSLIVAPKDLTTFELGWASDKCELPPELVGELTNVMKEHFTQDYKINDLLLPICEQALFETGSYPLVVIPESSLDNIINQKTDISLESYQTVLNPDMTVKSVGILGPGYANAEDAQKNTASTKISLESYSLIPESNNAPARVWFDDHLQVLDNLDNLKLPKLHDKRRADALRKTRLYGKISVEDAQRDKELEALDSALFARRGSVTTPVVNISSRGGGRESKGNPLVIRWPSESLIPIHRPGAPTDHLGYFGLIDEYGNPVTRVSSQDYYNQLTSNMQSPMDNYNNQAGTILENVKTYFGPNEQANKYDSLQLLHAYGQLMKKELLVRLKRGLHGENVELADVERSAYAIMLSRSLANMRTNIVYIPVEQCAYFAFDYTNAGLGKSVLSDAKIVGALRSLLLFADVQGAIRNSIPRRENEILLDEQDPDPWKTVETIQHEFAKTQNSAFPLGVTDPRTQLDMLQKAGITWSISGHPQYPNTKLTTTETTSSLARPDNELSTNIKNMMFMGIGIPPEIIDATQGVEFAATIFSSNLLLAKRSAQKQAILLKQMKYLVQIYTVSNGFLLESMKKVVDNHKDKLKDYYREGDVVRYSEIMERYLSALKLTLPTMDTARLATQLQDVNDFLALLDVTLPLYINEQVITETLGSEAGMQATAIYQAFRNNYAVDWMIQNNIMPELYKLVNIGNDDDNPGYNFMAARLEKVTNISSVVQQVMKQLADKHGGEPETPPETGASDFGSFGDDNTEPGSDSESNEGDDDLGGFNFPGE